ncbi:copper ion binding [Raphanus sativus]|nr:copper ion binding [Raphanus sativus]
MVGGGNRRDEGSMKPIQNTNLFAALDTRRKKKKQSDKAKASSEPEPQVFWSPTPLKAKAWADIDSDDEDDDYFATTAPPPPQSASDAKEVRKVYTFHVFISGVSSIVFTCFE